MVRLLMSVRVLRWAVVGVLTALIEACSNSSLEYVGNLTDEIGEQQFDHDEDGEDEDDDDDDDDDDEGDKHSAEKKARALARIYRELPGIARMAFTCRR